MNIYYEQNSVNWPKKVSILNTKLKLYCLLFLEIEMVIMERSKAKEKSFVAKEENTTDEEKSAAAAGTCASQNR